MSAAELPAEAAPEEDRDRPHLEVVAEPGRIASLRADLRPYLPTREQLRTPLAGVGAGTRVLIRQGCTWIAKDGWIWEGWTKVGAVAGGVYFGLPAVWTVVQSVTGPYAAFVPTAAAVCGCVAAKRFAPAEEEKKGVPAPAAKDAAESDEDEDAPEYLDEEGDELIEAAEVADLIRSVAARQQHQGAHLEDLLAESLFEGWDKAELKTALTDQWGLPVEGFKLIFKTPEGKAQRNRDGVRLRHLPPAPVRGVGEGPVRGLSLVPSQTPAEDPASTPPEALASTPSGGPAEAAVEAVVGPSPTAPAAPS
ncbi:hypothetical protein [Streptomyces sp. NBC_01233]|uniref:hypothetical protein n=1 Tax=Streptomyces sp. NBC_01233 TaxID=2903787 RepID=UPI002E1196D1|nr:hypothetical protein OG332_47605 [Streptomyces sp. NBC_01233]